MRSDINALRLFEELRLHPWKENDKLIIDAHLAMLGVTNPKEAVAMTEKYSKKLDEYLAKQPKKEEPKPVEVKKEPKSSGTIVSEVKIEEKPNKKYKKLSSPLSDVQHI